MAFIKQVNLGTSASPNLYDIQAKELLDTVGTGHSYEDIIALINKGLQIVIDSKHASKDEPATTASASTMGKLYLVQLAGQTASGTYTEFITLESGTSTKTYSWEKIGTTAADLTDYAKKTEAGKPGTYTSTTPSNNATSSNGAQTASGTATVTVQVSANATGNAGAATITSASNGASELATTGNGGAATVNFSNATFAGTSATITVESDAVTLNDHSYKPAGTIGGSQTISGHSHSVNAATDTFTAVTAIPNFSGGSASGTFNTDAIKDVSLAASTVSTDGPAYVESVTHTAASLTGDTTFVKSITGWNGGTFTQGSKATFTQGAKAKLVNKGTATPSVDIMTSPTVTNGVLSWVLGTFSSNGDDSFTANGNDSFTAATCSIGNGSVGISGGSIAPVTKYMKRTLTNAATASVGWTPASLGTLTKGTITYVKSITLNKNADVTVSGSNFSFSGTTATLTHDFTDATVSAQMTGAYTPAGSISGTQSISAHSHSYNAPKNHTHDVTIANHTHAITLTNTTITGTASVAVSSHTHSLNNHTHNTTVPAIAQ